MKKSIKRKRSKFSLYLASKRGKQVLNKAYSWGAAVVIIGALFKLLHWPFGDQMLFIGMMTEFFVFFLSGLEEPEEPYHWEEVFPELDPLGERMSEEERLQRRQFFTERAQQAHHRAKEMGGYTTHLHNSTPRYSAVELLPEEELQQLRNSIQRLGNAIDQLSHLGELTHRMSQQWMSVDLDTLKNQTLQYQEQVATLAKNLTELNRMYQNQLDEVTQQVAAIERVNSNVDQLRKNYESALPGSHVFSAENARLAHQMQELSRIYARLLDAMTVNMSIPPSYRDHRDPYYHTPSYPQAHPYPTRDSYNKPNETQTPL